MNFFTKKPVAILAALCMAVTTQAQLNYQATNAVNTTQTWTDISSSGTSISTGNTDDANSSSVSIGFTFKFNGTDYTDFVLNTNGFIKLGTNAPSATNLCYTTVQGNTGDALSSQNAGDSCILAAFNMDLQAGVNGNTGYQVLTSGSSPNQVCTIQFTNVRDKLTAAAAGIQFDEMSFQIKLYEGSNIIEYVYGPQTASSNATNFKTCAVGLKGSDYTTNSLITVTKASATAWSGATFLTGNYTGNTHNVRNTFLVDSGRTYRFVPTYAKDMAITNIYSLGRMAIPFANPHVVKVRVYNAGTDPIDTFWVYLSNAKNGFLDSVQFTSTFAAGGSDYAYFTIAPTVLGLDTLTAWTSADDNTSNSIRTWNSDINPNAYSYSEASKGPTGGVGFNGVSGRFVAKFITSQANFINQVRVNFTGSGQPYRISIWDIDANTGQPNNQLFISAPSTTAQGLAVVSVNPPVGVSGDFFVGVEQTNTTNVGFAYQAEVPIRDSFFYYDGGGGWTDFATTNSNFRFMIEPRLMLKKDVGVIKLVSPNKDSCQAGNKRDLTFQIQNLGLDTIDMLKDSILVYANVTGPGDTVPTTYGPYTVNTGMLVSNDTLNVTITNTFDFSENGDYTFTAWTMMAMDSNPLNDTLPAEIRSSTGATAIVTQSSTAPICPGDTVVLSAGQSIGAILFQWYKDGVSIPSGLDSVYYATDGGKYSCEIFNGFGCPAYSDTLTVTTKATPPANISVAAQGFCPGDSVMMFTNGGGGNYSFQWINTGGNINGATDSVYYASSADDYSVWVKDNTSGCAITSGIFTISAFSAPTASVTVNGNTKFCQGDSSQLDGSASTGTYYQWWMNGSAISGATNFDYYAKTSGDYQLQSITTQGCSDVSAVTTITVDSLPNTSITTHTGKNSFCDLDSLQLIAASVSGYTYEWNDGFGPIAGATNNTYTTFSAGDFSLTVYTAAGCSAVSNVINVTINSSPNADINAVNRTQFCQGDSEMIELTTPASGQTYQWLLNGSPVSGQTSFRTYGKDQGDHEVEVTVTTTGCKTISLPTSLTVFSSPDPKIIAGGSLALCQGDSVKLEVTSNGTTSLIEWKRNGSYISGANASFYYASTAGNYTVYVEGTNGCNGTSAVSTITVNPLPTASFTAGAGNVLTANTGTGYTYQWYRNGQPIPGATGQTYNAIQHGDYAVEVTDGNGCSKMSAAQGFNIGVSLPSAITAIDVFPNPSAGIFTIRTAASAQLAASLHVTDMLGKTVLTKPAMNLAGIHTVDLSTMANGVYVLKVEVSGQVFTTRLMKE